MQNIQINLKYALNGKISKYVQDICINIKSRISRNVTKSFSIRPYTFYIFFMQTPYFYV